MRRYLVLEALVTALITLSFLLLLFLLRAHIFSG